MELDYYPKPPDLQAKGAWFAKSTIDHPSPENEWPWFREKKFRLEPKPDR